MQKLKLEKEISTTYNFYFQYDSLQNLIHAQEYIIESNYAAHTEIDVNYFYDNRNNLINQTVSDKTIYKPGYKHRGVSYDNDTLILKYRFNYNSKDNITIAYRYEQWQNTKLLDSFAFNCSFDSLFVSNILPKDIKFDSLGRIIEKTLSSIHAMPIGGGPCLTPDSPNDRIKKYFYNEDGRLYKTEVYFRKGDFISRRFWNYDSNGLLTTKQYENALQITSYEYEYY